MVGFIETGRVFLQFRQKNLFQIGTSYSSKLMYARVFPHSGHLTLIVRLPFSSLSGKDLAKFDTGLLLGLGSSSVLFTLMFSATFIGEQLHGLAS